MKKYCVWRSIFVACMILVISVTCTGCKREETMTLMSISWEYDVEIEKQVMCEEDGWYLPSGAELIEKKREIYDEEYDEEGNFEGYEYRTRYYYKIPRWKYSRTVTQKGSDNNPFFPQYVLNQNERVARRRKHHYIHGVNQDGENVVYEVEKEQWSDLGRGDLLQLEVTIWGGATILSNRKAIEKLE